MAIKFLKTRERYGCFSNFSRHPVQWHGKTYATTEHLYQALKFDDAEKHESVRNQPTARAAADLGRSLTGVKTNWEQIKYMVMKSVIRTKIAQHPDIAITLLSTGNEDIIEDFAGDDIWACGADGLGKNWLGKIWQELRTELSSMLYDPVAKKLVPFEQALREFGNEIFGE